jgi:competence protein ComEA
MQTTDTGPVSEPEPDRAAPGDAAVVGDTVALDHLLGRAGGPGAGGSRRRPVGGFGGGWAGRLAGSRHGPTVMPRAALVAAVAAAAVVGFFGWRVLARPAPIEDRMPMASATTAPEGSSSPTGGPGGGSSVATDAAPGAGSGAGSGASGGSSTDSEVGGPEAASAGSADAVVVVHVTGAVSTPGVVRLPRGSRVAEALAAVGGATPDADAQRLNLAALLVDGSRIEIPRLGAEPTVEVTTSVAPPAAPAGAAGAAGGGGGGAPGPVELNTATAEELDTLPGVGPSTAAAIIEHRERVGPFVRVDDLLEVRGIGEAKLEALRDLVTVG